jgi:hypothetical protein
MGIQYALIHSHERARPLFALIGVDKRDIIPLNLVHEERASICIDPTYGHY